jgi:ribosome biogenesis GTPase
VPAQPAAPVVVVRLTRKGAFVETADAETLEAGVAGRLHRDDRRETSPVAVGDEVTIEREGTATTITAVAPRRSVILRPEVSGRWKRQILVANADRAVLIFAGRDPDPHAGLVDRLLVACHAGNVPPLLVFNKADLGAGPEATRLIAVYERLGYEVLHASATDGTGIEALRGLLAGRRCVFAGPSGAGKSSLVNRALPGVRLRTGEISHVTGKGKHTTTAAQLVRVPPLPGETGGDSAGSARSGHVIDTPGIKEFGLAGIPPRELDLHFPEFPVPGRCSFRDCRHLSEPGCAVRTAVEAGEVARSRYDSYRTFLAEIEADEQGDNRR